LIDFVRLVWHNFRDFFGLTISFIVENTSFNPLVCSFLLAADRLFMLYEFERIE